MPASDRPEPQTAPAPPAAERRAGDRPDPEQELEGLAAAVERLLQAYVELRARTDRAEAAERSLADALEGADLEGVESAEIASRLKAMADENRSLRQVIEESRERAQRIRSRLILMEDEA
jgi:predicted RNase H-like nuclease (RuvC/YqgF family)